MILDIYKSILAYSGLEADDQGFISIKMGEKKTPLLIDGMSLVLPTTEQLRNAGNSNVVIFHPLSENILRGESHVIQKFKDVINVRLNYTIGVVAQSLLQLLSSPEQHKHLSTDQADILTCVTETDEKALTNFIAAMVSGMKSKPERVFSNIYLKKGGVLDGKKFARLSVVTFPFLATLEESKLRKKDQKVYKELLAFMFPEPDQYNFGSNSRVAPYLDALLTGSLGIASKLNDLLSLYEPYIENAEELMFSDDWVDAFQNLEGLVGEIRKIPSHLLDAPEPIVPVQAPNGIPPQYQQAPPPAYPAPAPAPAPLEPPKVVSTANGIDFRSLAQSNPAIAAYPNPLAPALQQQYYMQNPPPPPQEPSWATQNPVYPPQAPGGYPTPYAQPYAPYDNRPTWAR